MNENSITKYQKAIDKAAEWLKSQRQNDGSLKREASLLGYYTAPVFYRASGMGRDANFCLRYIENNFLNKNGELIQPEGVWDTMKPYPQAWVSISANIWGRDDIARKTFNWALSYQDPQTGGIFGEEKDRQKGKGRIDFDSSSIVGIAGIELKRENVVHRIGSYLLRLYKSQPDLDNRFLWQWDTENGIITDYPQKEAAKYALTVGKDAEMSTYRHGLLIIFFVKYFLYTGDERFLKAAEEHFDFALNSSKDLFEYGFCHKFGWGSALLYKVTGKEKYKKGSIQVADLLCSLQQSDGRFFYKGAFENIDAQPYDGGIDITVQFANWIANTLWILEE